MSTQQMYRKFGGMLIVGTMIFALSVVGYAQTEPPFYLKSDKPFAGEEINVLLHISDAFRAVEKRTSQFEKLTGIKVNYIWAPYPVLHEKLIAALIGGKGKYDVVNNVDTWISETANYTVNLQAMIDEDKSVQDYPEILLKMCSFEGKLLALPNRSHAQFIFYRKDIFNKLGLEAPDTWDDVVKAGKTIQQNTDLKGIAMYYGRVSPTAMHNFFIWYPMLRGLGGCIFDENMEPIFNNEIGVKATERYIGFMLKDKITPIGSVAFDEYGAALSFAHGKSAMWPNWEYAYPLFQDPERSTVVGKFGVAPLPKWKNKPRFSSVITHALSIPLGSRHKEAAWEYIKWASSAALQKELVLAGESIVVNRIANLVDPELNTKFNNLFKAKLESFRMGGSLPSMPEWAEISNVLSATISDIASGMPIKLALDKAVEDTRNIMKRAGYYK